MVTARLYSRFFITKAPGFDDALAFLALLLSIALSVLIIIGNKVWWSGHHVWDISMDVSPSPSELMRVLSSGPFEAASWALTSTEPRCLNALLSIRKPIMHPL